MKQLSFLSRSAASHPQNNSSEVIEVYIDGASRSNPGPAGAGIFIKKADTIKKLAYFLGNKTNNQAEYLALVLALIYLKSGNVKIVSDSELLVKQIKGEYKVRNEGLKDLFILAEKLLENFSYKIAHVLREKNKEADKLANIAIDKKKEVPASTKAHLLEYGIKI